MFCNTNLAAQPTPTRDRAPNCNLGDRKAALSPQVPEQSQEGKRSPRPAQAALGLEEVIPDHPHVHGRALSAPRWGRGNAASAAGGPGSLQTAHRWLPATTASDGFELVPRHRKLQALSSAPSKFSSTKIDTERGRRNSWHPSLCRSRGVFTRVNAEMQ